MSFVSDSEDEEGEHSKGESGVARLIYSTGGERPLQEAQTPTARPAQPPRGGRAGPSQLGREYDVNRGKHSMMYPGLLCPGLIGVGPGKITLNFLKEWEYRIDANGESTMVVETEEGAFFVVDYDVIPGKNNDAFHSRDPGVILLATFDKGPGGERLLRNLEASLAVYLRQPKTVLAKLTLKGQGKNKVPVRMVSLIANTGGEQEQGRKVKTGTIVRVAKRLEVPRPGSERKESTWTTMKFKKGEVLRCLKREYSLLAKSVFRARAPLPFTAFPYSITIPKLEDRKKCGAWCKSPHVICGADGEWDCYTNGDETILYDRSVIGTCPTIAVPTSGNVEPGLRMRAGRAAWWDPANGAQKGAKKPRRI